MNKSLLALIALALMGLACTLTNRTQSLAAPLPTATQTAAAPAATHTPGATVTPSPTPPALALVTAQALHLRACPGIDCEIVGALTGGQIVTLVSTQTAPDGGTWSNIKTQTGQAGWVNTRYLEGR